MADYSIKLFSLQEIRESSGTENVYVFLSKGQEGHIHIYDGKVAKAAKSLLNTSSNKNHYRK